MMGEETVNRILEKQDLSENVVRMVLEARLLREKAGRQFII